MRFFRVAALLAVVPVLVGIPPTGAQAAPARFSAAAAPTPVAEPEGARHATRARSGSDAHENSRRAGRRMSNAWTGRRILYTESISGKWDWSLSTAISKWNQAGGGIRFVPTTKPGRARLNIAYGDIGRAAGLATVGPTRHAWVRLSSSYSGADASDPRNRVQVMVVLTHELGHVLGFEHVSSPCALMSAVLDVDGCNTLPATMPGYYSCRTIDPALETRFVRLYGGRARMPRTWCPIGPVPSAAVPPPTSGGQSS